MKKTNTKNQSFLGAGWAVFFFLGALGIWQFHQGEFLSRFDLVPGGLGDPCMVGALLEYIHRGLSGKTGLISLPFYFPAPGTLGYSDAYLSHAFLFDLLRRMGWGLFSSYQAAVLLFNFLNYICCFLLLRSGFRLGISSSAFGAFFFAFNAPKFNQTGHTQLQCLFWIPLAVWALVVFGRGSQNQSRWKAFALLALAGLAFQFEILTAYYPAWFFLFFILLSAPIVICFSEVRNQLAALWGKNKIPLAAGGLVFFLGLIPFLRLYLPVERDLGGKDFSEAQMMIPRVCSFFWMGPRHGIWGFLWDQWESIRNLPVEGEERIGFGLAALIGWLLLNALVFSGLFQKIKTASRVYKGFGKAGLESGPWFTGSVLAVDLFVLLGLQYGSFTPWRLVYDWVPGASAVRAVSRYALFLALPLAVLFSFSLEGLFRKFQARGRFFGVLSGTVFLWMAAVVGEQVDLPAFPCFSKSAQMSRLTALSEKLPESCGAFYVTASPGLPLVPAYSATEIQIDAMLISALKGIPTLNGYSGHTPLGWGLYKVRSPRYMEYVSDWIKANHLGKDVCGLEIDR